MFKEVPGEVYVDGVSRLVKMAQGGESNAYVCFFYYDTHKKVYGHIQNSGPCHSPLNYVDIFSKNEVPLFVVTRGGRSAWGDFKELSKDNYCGWVVNDSPWADAHLVKDKETITESGYHIDLSLPNNYVMSACITARHSWEFADRNLEDWRVFTSKHKMHPTTALILRYQSFLTEKGNLQKNRWGMHPAFHVYGSLEYYKNLFNGKMIYSNKPYSQTKYYKDVDKLWGNTGDGYYDNFTIFDLCQKIYLEELENEETVIDTKQFTHVNPFYERIRFIEKEKSRGLVEIPGRYIEQIGKRLTEILASE